MPRRHSDALAHGAQGSRDGLRVLAGGAGALRIQPGSPQSAAPVVAVLVVELRAVATALEGIYEVAVELADSGQLDWEGFGPETKIALLAVRGWLHDAEDRPT